MLTILQILLHKHYKLIHQLLNITPSLTLKYQNTNILTFNISSTSELYSKTCNKLNSQRHSVKHVADKIDIFTQQKKNKMCTT